MRSAVIDPKTGAVLNVIMADPAVDASPEPNTILVDAGDLPIAEDWRWTEKDGWIAPDPAPVPVINPPKPVQSF
jgi:hypothetical protein